MNQSEKHVLLLKLMIISQTLDRPKHLFPTVAILLDSEPEMIATM